MADKSNVNRTTTSNCGNIRDSEDDDDNEFFDNNENSDDEEFEENVEAIEPTNVQLPDPVNNILTSNATSSQVSSYVARTGSSNSFRRLQFSNLSKITEAPDELSFSFKHGENALQTINEDHERWGHEDYLRLPSGSFHTSRYSIKNSWEESALRHQYAITRSELDLSHIQVSSKADNTYSDILQNTSSSHQQCILQQQIPQDLTKDSNYSNVVPQIQQQRSPLSSSILLNTNGNNGKQFISGNRYTIYFGFRRLDGLDSEETLIIHNIHHGHERLRIRCWMKTKKNFLKLISPIEKAPLILEWNAYQKIIISFTPTSFEHYVNYLCVQCQSRTESITYKFLVHGFGGRPLVTPFVEDRSTNLLVSANGRYQLLVNSANSFSFLLQNKGNRCAFASILIYGRGGELIPHHEVMVNKRTVLLDKMGQDTSRRSITIRCLTDRRSFQSQSKSTRPSTLSSVMSALSTSTAREESTLQIIIFWGDERQRQRLKQLEKKLDGLILTFGQNFTKYMNFCGEIDDWAKDVKEHYISEEEFYYFNASVKLIFIDVHEKKSHDRSACVNIANTSGGTQPIQRQQLRVGSSLSVASSGTDIGRSRQQQQLRTIVERDPDNTMVGVGSVHDSTDDTLTLL